MKIKWYVDDGLVGKYARYTEVDDGEIEECETEEGKEQLIEEHIQEDFEQRISWYRG